MYQALYRKYRPKTFDDIVGQQVIIKTLTNSILKDKISHAYLFTGPRGTGKTSVAKILAKIVNCQKLNGITPCNSCISCEQFNNKQNIDIIEIDAASNNGVDEIRELRDKVNLVPSFGKYKVYIIDEVHMLTTAAFNALLKTLEEPPSHIIFILATTEPHKIPLTILSRCQRYDFKKVSILDIKKRIKYICEQEKIEIDEDALDLISKLSDGGMRDSIGLLDQLTVYSNDKIKIQDVQDVYGTVGDNIIENFIVNILDGNLETLLNIINDFDINGKNLVKITEAIIEKLKNCLIYENDSNYFNSSDKQMYDNIIKKTNSYKLFYMINELLETIRQSKNTNNYRLIFELSIIKMLGNNENSKKLQQKVEKEPVFEQKKPIIVKKSLKSDVNDRIDLNVYDSLKKIRINNTLANYSKRELLEFKTKIDNFRNYILDQEYSEISSIILDGELKAKGNKNLIFVYNISKMDEYFNINLKKIQNLFFKIFNEEYFPIAVSNDEWEIIKQDFNNSKKNKENKYIYEEEDINLDLLMQKKEQKNENNEKTNNIELNFDDIIVYN